MRRVLSFLLVMLMVLALVPAALAAEEEFRIIDYDPDRNSFGSVYPEGAQRILTDYNGPGGAVTVPDGVDTICNSGMGECYPVFGSDSNVTSVVLSASVKILGPEAFEYCSTLKKVTFTGGLEKLGLLCFKDCTGLTDIAIPEGITELETRVFSGCIALAHITLPASLQSIHRLTFENCTALREVTYTGTRAQWRASYAAVGSQFDKSIVVHCADGDYKDAGSSNFVRKSTYQDGQFSDVKATDWFSGDVRTAVEFGLMKGTGSGSFSPDGNISIAETLALVSRIHHIYYGGDGVFTQGSPWYQVYVDYAVENGMISAGSYTDLSAPATRAQFSTIISKALPAPELSPINTVDDQAIPDVTSGAPYSAAVYQLYRAGILVGSDAIGTFYPDSTIGRSAVAAIASRMVDKTLRKSVTLTRTTLYTPDGRTVDVPSGAVDAYLAVGWYNTPVTVLYALDGRTQVVPTSEVDAYVAVGWYKSLDDAKVTLYALDGRTVTVMPNEVDAYLAVGWYKSLNDAKVTLYAPDKRKIAVMPDEVDAYLSAGWYRSADEASAHMVPFNTSDLKLTSLQPSFSKYSSSCPIFLDFKKAGEVAIVLDKTLVFGGYEFKYDSSYGDYTTLSENKYYAETYVHSGKIPDADYVCDYGSGYIYFTANGEKYKLSFTKKGSDSKDISYSITKLG